MPETRRKDDPELREGTVRIVRETGAALLVVARGRGSGRGCRAPDLAGPGRECGDGARQELR